MIFKKYWWLWMILGIILLYGFATAIGKALSSEIALVRITGTIDNSKEIVSWVETLKGRPQVRGVLLYINSPGGGIVPSDEIYRSIIEFKKVTKKPVVAYLGSVAASGGYYIACSADYIVAHPMSLTGSIGVIFEIPVVKKLMDKIGVEMVVIKSGPNKDMGSPFKKMTEEERKIIENIISQGYSNFVRVVADARKISEDSVRKIADGRVLTGQDAYKLGLVDTLGDLSLAKNKIKSLAGVKGPVVFTEKKSLPYFLRVLNPEGEGITKILMPHLEYRMVLQ
jgi:protease-4